MNDAPPDLSTGIIQTKISFVCRNDNQRALQI